MHQHRAELAERRRQISIRKDANLLPCWASCLPRANPIRSPAKTHRQGSVGDSNVHQPEKVFEAEKSCAGFAGVRQGNACEKVRKINEEKITEFDGKLKS